MITTFIMLVISMRTSKTYDAQILPLIQNGITNIMPANSNIYPEVLLITQKIEQASIQGEVHVTKGRH